MLATERNGAVAARRGQIPRRLTFGEWDVSGLRLQWCMVSELLSESVKDEEK